MGTREVQVGCNYCYLTLQSMMPFTCRPVEGVFNSPTLWTVAHRVKVVSVFFFFVLVTLNHFSIPRVPVGVPPLIFVETQERLHFAPTNENVTFLAVYGLEYCSFIEKKKQRNKEHKGSCST